MEFERRRHSHTHINIAPLVDMVFLLLLFFMLTSHWILEPAIKVRLPASKTAGKDENQKSITITQNGEIYFMDKRIDLNDLKKVIRQYTKDYEKDFLKIKADREVKVGFLVKVIDEVRLSGVKNFSIVTERR